MSSIKLKHSGGNVVSLNSPTNAPSAADVAFKLDTTGTWATHIKAVKDANPKPS